MLICSRVLFGPHLVTGVIACPSCHLLLCAAAHVPEEREPNQIAARLIKAGSCSSSMNAFGLHDHECEPSVEHHDTEADVKKQIAANIKGREEEYNVASFYHETGMAKDIATSPVFEQVTLLVITVNAVWMWIDIDYNKEKLLSDAELHFRFMEHFFCAFFSLELFVRFCAFKNKSAQSSSVGLIS